MGKIRKRGSTQKMSPSAIRLPQLVSAEHVWKAFDTWLFDADGVLWRELMALEGAVQLVQRLIGAGKRVFVVTNNATKSAEEYATKCHKMGFTGLSAENIVCSGAVLAHHIKRLKSSPDHAATAHLPVYLIGSAGLQKLLEREGIDSFGAGPDTVPGDQEFNFDSALQFISTRPAFAVVGSFDAHLSYPKVVKAVNYLKDPAIPFLVTNEDAVFPGSEPGSLVPGAGTVTSVLRYVSGREPLVMGKPSPLCWQFLCDRFPGQLDPKRTLMIGDRCDTDILFGQNAGLAATLLVLTGVTTMAQVEQFAAQGKDSLVADYFVPTLSQLLPSAEAIL